MMLPDLSQPRVIPESALMGPGVSEPPETVAARGEVIHVGPAPFGPLGALGNDR